MDIISLFDRVNDYSGDIVLMAIFVALTTSLIKFLIKDKISLENTKYVTILPFILGIVFLAIYDFVLTKAIRENVISSGVQCGMVATMYYVVYEQFVKNKCKLTSVDRAVLETILSKIIGSEKLDEIITQIESVIKTGKDIALIVEDCTNIITAASENLDTAVLSELLEQIVKIIKG